ncbi:helix-turn-helix transcriptional regulator [Streptomyces sp. CT34]|uniref:helix-turn-helix transcriptional regulator n=1 Tax=Streptomyces sp. CT34 TaxID=1553907 RepID=UPI000691A7ED|nr:helix-turn-helix transcriptional regulator [Streptomyces sp. CT34]
MPPRQFNGPGLRTMRRGAGFTQAVFAKMVGVSKTAVIDWEKDDEQCPPPERLPAIAKALGEDLDVLFPRFGPPDLADLRADAGFTQSRAAEALGITRVPLSNAETGKKPLSSDLRIRVVALYGVTADELAEAQKRSFSTMTPAPMPTHQTPRGLTERLRFLLECRPKVTNADVAAAVNQTTGAGLEAQDVEDVRTRARSAEQVFAGLSMGAVREGLAKALSVAPFEFQDGEEVEQEVLDRLAFLADKREGGATVNARGAAHGVSPEMVATIKELLLRKSGKQK